MPRADLVDIRGGTTDQWAEANPVLAENEIAVDMDLRTLKVGDGSTPWNDLPPVGSMLAVTTVDDDTYTVAASDAGDAIRFTAAATVTLPAGVPVGTVVELIAYHADGLTVQGDGTSTVRNAGTLAQYGAVSCLSIDTDEWLVTGPITA